MRLIYVFRQIRVYQWIKNLLVFAPLLVSYRFFGFGLFTLENFWLMTLLFVAFSLFSSSVYVVNDLVDKEHDRKHPVKKDRPIAAGKISTWQAFLILVVLLSVAGLLMTYFNWKTNVILGGYFVLNLVYSWKLKNLPIIEMLLVAFMYFLRVKAGGALLNVHVSEWLMVVVFFLALFIIVGKRNSEYRINGDAGVSTRKVLAAYNSTFLDHLLTILVSGVLLSYSLYAIEAGIPYLMYSIFFVFFGVFRYLYLVYRFNKGEVPEKLIFQDGWLLVSMVGWLSYIILVFYYNTNYGVFTSFVFPGL